MPATDLHLSERQQQLLSLLSQGKSNKEIAFDLHITEGTVKQHLFALYRKLGVTNRTKAILRIAEINDQQLGQPLRFHNRTPASDTTADPSYLWKLITAVVVQPLTAPDKTPTSIARFDQSLGQLRRQVEHLARLLDCHLLFAPGGAVLACFGSPISHLDDSARALHFARLVAQSHQQSDGGLDIGIGVATAAEIVQESNLPPIHAESFKLAQQLANGAHGGEIRASEVACRLAGPLFSSSPLPENKTSPLVGARLVHVVQETAPAILAERNPLPFIAEVITRFGKLRQAEWISVESWPPSAGVRLMDAISVHCEAAGLPVLRLRLPTAKNHAQLAASVSAQINLQTGQPPASMNRAANLRPELPVLGALQTLAQHGPHVICVYGINSLNQLMETLELHGLHDLAPCPLLFVGMRIHEDASAYVAARMLGGNPAAPSHNRIFKLGLGTRPIAPNELDADLLTLLDLLSPSARQWARTIATEGHVQQSAVGAHARELLSCGLFQELGGVIHCRDDKTRHALHAHLVRDFSQVPR